MIPQKTIGKRIPRPERTTEEIRDFLNLVIKLSKGRTKIRKGIYYLKSYDGKWTKADQLTKLKTQKSKVKIAVQN